MAWSDRGSQRRFSDQPYAATMSIDPILINTGDRYNVCQLGQQLEHNMKKLIFAASLVLASFASAEAACTKKSLNGTWQFDIAAPGAAGVVGTMAGGVLNVSYGATNFALTISTFSKSSCRGTGTLLITGDPPVPVKFTAERINSSSPDKPNMLIVFLPVGAGVNYSLGLTRY
jgi:hypothetical protein